MSAVNAGPLTKRKFVAALDVTAAADSLDDRVGEEGVDEGFHIVLEAGSLVCHCLFSTSGLARKNRLKSDLLTIMFSTKYLLAWHFGQNRKAMLLPLHCSMLNLAALMQVEHLQTDFFDFFLISFYLELSVLDVVMGYGFLRLSDFSSTRSTKSCSLYPF